MSRAEYPLATQPITYGLVGAGGFGRGVMPILAQMLDYQPGEPGRGLIFVVEGEPPLLAVNGYPAHSLDAFLALSGPKFFNVAIADSRTRERIATHCIDAGIEPLAIISPSAFVVEESSIGVGAIISPFASVGANATIGRFFHAHFYCRVSHDCIIGDFVTFAPAVQCNGHVTIGDHAFVGAGALIRQGTAGTPLRIGEGAVVGMGAVVIRDVDPHTTVAGNPARPLKR